MCASRRACKLQQDKTRATEDLLGCRELAVKTVEETYEQKMKNELLRYPTVFWMGNLCSSPFSVFFSFFFLLAFGGLVFCKIFFPFLWKASLQQLSAIQNKLK